MWMQLDGEDFRRWIASSEDRSLAPGRGATVQQAGASADEQCDQLRTFILNNDSAIAECGGAGKVADIGCKSSSAGENGPRREIDSLSISSASAPGSSKRTDGVGSA